MAKVKVEILPKDTGAPKNSTGGGLTWLQVFHSIREQNYGSSVTWKDSTANPWITGPSLQSHWMKHENPLIGNQLGLKSGVHDRNWITQILPKSEKTKLKRMRSISNVTQEDSKSQVRAPEGQNMLLEDTRPVIDVL